MYIRMPLKDIFVNLCLPAWYLLVKRSFYRFP